MGTHKKSAANDEVSAVLDSIRRIVHALRVGSRAAEKMVGLTSAQLFVLYKLADGPTLSLNELADRTRTHQSSVSVVVQRLVDRGLVDRARSGGDARRIELHLTAAARRLLGDAPDTAQQRLIAAIERMTTASRKNLSQMLIHLTDELGSPDSAPMMFFEESHPPARKTAGRSLRPRVARPEKTRNKKQKKNSGSV
jgi:DNA-binding MarR family transcriptional regulator